MRFKINLNCIGKAKFLPVDYQYSMASAIYKLIAKGDEVYSRFLHDVGHSPGGLRRFKLFTFSPLALPNYTLWKEKAVFELHQNQLSFIVSFMADKTAETFVKGMFTDQHFSIGDRFHQLDMEVIMVEAVSPPLFKETMIYRCVSPVVVELKEPNKRYETYVAPDDPRFEELLIQNLVSKCAALDVLYNNGYSEEDLLRFRLKSDYKSKLITIKPFTAQQTKVRGFLFDFELTAPEYMQEMGYYGGFGMNNGMGFGCPAIDSNLNGI